MKLQVREISNFNNLMLKLPPPKFNGYEIAAKVSLPFLPSVRSIHIHGELEHGAKASLQQFSYYDSLTRDDFPAQGTLDDCAYAYYLEVAAVIDVRDFGLNNISRESIGHHYRIELVTVPPLGGKSHRLLILSGECNWDPEHGIQFIVKNSDVIATGASDGIYQAGGWTNFLIPASSILR